MFTKIYEEFYDSFHRNTKIQRKVITKINFTYITAIAVIEEYLKQDTSEIRKFKILDYGSGAGTLDFYLANKGYSVTGFDISAKAVSVANSSAHLLRLNSNVKFHTSKSLSLGLRGRKYNMVLCLEVIEHVKNDIKLIRLLLNHLNKGCYLIISTPSINAPLYKLGLTYKFDKKVGHLRRYDDEELKGVLLSMPEVDTVALLKKEGVIRNSLFVITPLSVFLRFIKGPLSLLITYIDNIFLRLFGASNIYLIIRKK